MTNWEKTRLLNLRVKKDIGFKLTSAEIRILARLEKAEQKEAKEADKVLADANRLAAQTARLIKQAKKITFAIQKKRNSKRT